MSHRTTVRILSAATVLLSLRASGVGAQQSVSFRLQEHAFNAGGTPGASGIAASASFELRPGSLGDGVAGSLLTSASFRAGVGFSSGYPPAGDVSGLRFAAGHTTLEWDGSAAAATYRIYRDPLASLINLGYGACLQGDIAATSAIDPEDPLLEGGFFYLVTAVDRLREEGTKGWSSAGAERANAAPCP